MEHTIYTILEDGSYGPRPMTEQEIKEHEAIVADSVAIADRINPE